MPQAKWNDAVLAESSETKVVDGNHYFPPESLRSEHFKPSEAQTTCPCKGTASYYDVVVEGDVNPQAAWCYPEPKPEAAEIKGHVAFWKGVEVTG